VLRAVRARSVERVVVDVRHNTGVDDTTFGPLLNAMRDPAVNRPGRLFLVIGRQTFSAAGNFVASVEQHTGAVLVGEATGGVPNQFGDSVRIRLPGSGFYAAVSTVYHVRSTPDDPRLTHEPDVWAEVSAEDFFAGRDPALEAVLAFPTPE
jgi:C-terminal processing protease CtpA/Prc